MGWKSTFIVPNIVALIPGCTEYFPPNLTNVLFCGLRVVKDPLIQEDGPACKS